MMELSLVQYAALGACAVLLLYLYRVNSRLVGVPDEVRELSGPRWTPQELKETYQRLERHPIDIAPVAKMPPKQDRRYIVTGGSGLVGGFIVLQLLARGHPPESIRIVDIRKTQRNDMLSGPATEVEFVATDIASPASVEAAFSKPWHPSVAHLPLTVFHTAAVIIPSDRSKLVYSFPESVNVNGTKLLLEAARKHGADIFSATSSASIALRPVEALSRPWETWPRSHWQILDEKDFFKPLRPHEEFFGNYPASKAVAERLVCEQNCEAFRTGAIRPANGVYGNPTDNTVGEPLARDSIPTWTRNVVQSFVHGANVAIAHLHQEAVLLEPSSASSPQAGRPFVVTDPNPPITYGDLYGSIRALSMHSLNTPYVPPLPLLLISYVVEAYHLLPYRLPFLKSVLPTLQGDIKWLKPGLFSICKHCIAPMTDIKKPVKDGGLGYEGILTTQEGMVREILEWNAEHAGTVNNKRKAYTISIIAAEQIQKLGAEVTLIKY